VLAPESGGVQRNRFARGIEAICAEALPKFRPRNAGGQRGAAIPRRAGKRWDFGAGKPPAPDESKAEHIQAERPTRGLAGGHEEGTRHKKLISELFCLTCTFLRAYKRDLGVGC